MPRAERERESSALLLCGTLRGISTRQHGGVGLVPGEQRRAASALSVCVQSRPAIVNGHESVA